MLCRWGSSLRHRTSLEKPSKVVVPITAHTSATVPERTGIEVRALSGRRAYSSPFSSTVSGDIRDNSPK